MPRKITAIVARDESVPAGLVAAHLGERTEIELTDLVGSPEELSETIRRTPADILLVVCSPGHLEHLTLVQWWRNSRQGRPVLALWADPAADGHADADFVTRAFSVGAHDVMVLDAGAQVSTQTGRQVEFGIRKALTRTTTGGGRAPDAGTLVGVLGPKGGTGKTLTSTNLAMALAGRGRKTVLVDIDLQFGDVALSLGLNLEKTLFDLAISGGSLDGEKLEDFMLHHPSGLRVLAAPARPDQAASITPEMLAEIFKLLRSQYEFTIVDTPPYFSSEVIATIDASTHVCMLGMLDALSLKNTRLGIETLDLMGYDQDRVRVVLNRANSGVGISEADVVAILGRVPDVLVPSSRDVVRSVNEGAPVVISQPRSDMAKSFEALADLFVAVPAAEESWGHSGHRRSRGLFRRKKSVIATTVPTGEIPDGTA